MLRSLLWGTITTHRNSSHYKCVRRRTHQMEVAREGKMELDFGGKCISCVWHEVNEIILMMSNFRNGAFSSHFYRFKWREPVRVCVWKTQCEWLLIFNAVLWIKSIASHTIHTYICTRRKIQFCVVHIDTDDPVMEYLKLGTALWCALDVRTIRTYTRTRTSIHM